MDDGMRPRIDIGAQSLHGPPEHPFTQRVSLDTKYTNPGLWMTRARRKHSHRLWPTLAYVFERHTATFKYS